MLIPILAALAAAAAGATGTWSPCGLSMIETLKAPRSGRGRGVVVVACVTFLAGALAGGAATFGPVALLGGAIGGGGRAALGVAAAIGLAAAVGEVRGVRVVPQVRRQVPESWRRYLPLPVVAPLYGILLGLGFTTFVLTFGVWALMAMSLALGSLRLGLVIGLAFGLGRALPVMALAPWADGWARAIVLRMSERPALLRAARRSDGILLGVLAIGLAAGALTGAADASPRALVSDGWAPSAAGDAMAWTTSTGIAVVNAPAHTYRFPADEVAVGGGNIAVARDGSVAVLRLGADPAAGPPIATFRTPGVTALAVDAGWVVWRRPRPGGGDIVSKLPLDGRTGPRRVATTSRGTSLGRPGLAGDLVALSFSSPSGSGIETIDLVTGRRRIVRRSPLGQLRDPSLVGRQLLYVSQDYCVQRLLLGPVGGGGHDRLLLALGTNAVRDRGYAPGYSTDGSAPSRCPPGTPAATSTMMSATALTAGAATVALWRPVSAARQTARIVRVPIAAP